MSSEVFAGTLGAVIASLAWSVAPTRASGECLGLARGPVVYDVDQCAAIQPETAFPKGNPEYQWLWDLDANARGKFLNTYRGLALKGRVVKSEAVARGVSEDKGVLMGQNVTIFIPPGGGQCTTYQGKRVAAEIVEDCCQKGEPPCLVSRFVWSGAKIIGTADKGSAERPAGISKEARSLGWKEGFEALKSKNYKTAIEKFEGLRAAGKLDTVGHYYLGFAYRMEDQCRKAISPLRELSERTQRKDYWAGDEKMVRRGIMLLARCYAMTKDAGAAVLILNQYLVEPVRNREEIATGLNHEDFGWIKTTREYQEWRQAALKTR
jgi:hypothetical protein